MRRNTITPLSDIGRRAPEAGRIRLGVKSGRAMKALSTFRFTSPDRTVIEQLAALYGGEAKPWTDSTANPSNQFEVITKANNIRVMLTVDGLSTQYELWSGGGCQRRCDGVECDVPQRVGDDYELVTVPCMCNTNKILECVPKTRLVVVLPEVNFIGTWRLETKGWNAAQELPGMHDFIQAAAVQGFLVEARLSVVQRERMTAAGKRKFIVPQLSVNASLDGLAAGVTGAPALAGPAPAALTPAVSSLESIDDAVVVDAELIDDELEALEKKLRADARNFGLDEHLYAQAIVSSVGADKTRIQACLDQVRSGRLEPTGFDNGRVTWRTAT